IVHGRGRRRGALPGRPPPAWRRLHRRLVAREHVSAPCDDDVLVPRFEPVDADARAWSNGGQRAMSRMQRGRRIMRNLFRWGMVAWAVLVAAFSAQARSPAAYPDRLIRLAGAVPPGGATGTLTRQVTAHIA